MILCNEVPVIHEVTDKVGSGLTHRKEEIEDELSFNLFIYKQ